MLNLYTSLIQNGQYTIITGTLMTALTTIAVALRLLSKWVNKNKLGTDDWLIIAAQLLWYPQYGLQLHAMIAGRKATSELDPQFAFGFIKYIYLYAEFYFPMVLLTNLSIISFYSRIFSAKTNPAFRRLSTIIIVLLILWFIPGFLTETLICLPVNSLWTNLLEVPEKCIFYSSFFVIIFSIELGLDALILALPVREIYKLQLSWQKKIMLSFIFLLGGFVIITGIIRIVLPYKPGQQMVDFTLDVVWLNVHAGTAIICACLPTYRILVTKSFSLISNGFRKYSLSLWRTTPSSKNNGESGDKTASGHKKYTELHGDGVHLVGMNKWAKGGSNLTEDSDDLARSGTMTRCTGDIV